MRYLLSCFVLAAALATAQAPAALVLNLSAASDNVSGARDAIRIELFRWSSDAERDQFLSAWTNPGAAASSGRGRGRGGAGRGGAVPDPAADEDDAPPAAAGGRGGRGGRGGGAAAAPAARQTPESSLAGALSKGPTLGYLWSSEVAGYAIRYAVRLPQQDGGQRIILITERRLGEWNNLWKPTAPGTPTDYEFSVVEIHLNSKGEGEGKASLSGKVTADSESKTIALENYAALPIVLKNVKR